MRHPVYVKLGGLRVVTSKFKDLRLLSSPLATVMFRVENDN